MRLKEEGWCHEVGNSEITQRAGARETRNRVSGTRWAPDGDLSLDIRRHAKGGHVVGYHQGTLASKLKCCEHKVKLDLYRDLRFEFEIWYWIYNSIRAVC